MAEADTELREIWKTSSEEERNEWKYKREAPASKVEQVEESAPFVAHTTNLMTAMEYELVDLVVFQEEKKEDDFLKGGVVPPTTTTSAEKIITTDDKRTNRNRVLQ
jgi:hypothetical protein